MIDYLTKNHLSIIIIGWLVISFSLGIGIGTDTVRIVEVGSGLGSINRDTTTLSNPHTFQQGVTINANANGISNALSVQGTSSVISSFDGFIAFASVSSVATGTAAATFTNNFSPGICDGGIGAVYFDSTGSSPSLQVSLGILSDIDLLATTTIATTTDTVTELIDNSFLLASGGTVTLYLDDITNTEASSTHYSNWDIQFGVNCWTLGS